MAYIRMGIEVGGKTALCSVVGTGKYTEGERNSGSGNALAFSRLVRSSPSFPLLCFSLSLLVEGETDGEVTPEYN